MNDMRKSGFSFLGFLGGLLVGLILQSTEASALELDWSGQFWSEYNFIYNYSMDTTDAGSTVDTTRSGEGGYYIPAAGKNEATFQSLFLRLRPKLTVNDNIYIKSEWWVGDPIYGIFGNSLPYTVDQRQHFSSFSRGSSITAQRFWGEFVSDIGTVQVGRVPLSWGLGVVWNRGENLWARYMSTGDAVRLVSKFGAFTLIPSFIVPTTGNTIGGGASFTGSPPAYTIGQASGGVTDYSLVLKYENLEDEVEGGLNIIRRLGGASQDRFLLPGNVTGAMNYITYDFFARKNFQNLTLSAEIPVVSGDLGSTSYQSFAVATETNWRLTDSFEFILKAGYAPGQDNTDTGNIDKFRAFYFHPNYHIAMIMFNYQLRNFAGPQTLNNPNTSAESLSSPYYNPVVDAGYLSLTTNIKPSHKWTIRPALVYAYAPRAATDGTGFFNYWTNSLETAAAGHDQGKSLGFEFDLGITFQWDEYFVFSFDNGIFFPGSFFAFSNTPTDNRTTPVLASSVRVGLSF